MQYNFLREVAIKIEKLQTNKKLKMGVSKEKIACFYDGERFLEIREDGLFHTYNLSDSVDLNDPKSNSGYKLLYASDIMLIGAGVLNRSKEEACKE